MKGKVNQNQVTSKGEQLALEIKEPRDLEEAVINRMEKRHKGRIKKSNQ